MYRRHETDALAKRRDAAKAVQIRRTALLDQAEANARDVLQGGNMMQMDMPPATGRPPSPPIPASSPSAVPRVPTPEPEPPLLTQSGRPRRSYKLPGRYIDHPAEAPAPLPLPPVAPGSTALPRVILHVRDAMRSIRNSFGLRRDYSHRPSYDPDSAVPDAHLTTYYAKYQPAPSENSSHTANTSYAPPWPFSNMSRYLLMDWLQTGSVEKSAGEVNRLAKDVIGHPEFRAEDLQGFSAQKEGKLMDRSDSNSEEAAPFLRDGWQESSVDIAVPLGKKDIRGRSSIFTIPGLHHRSLLSIMKAALTDVTASRFHFTPFKRFWKPPDGPEQRCFDELYTSDAWLIEHDKLQKQPNEPECKLEKVILGLMFWSDSTHLANFGTAKVWPLYLYFGNLSKYFRGKPNSAASHHVAYIPSLPDSIHDFISPGSQKAPILTHCRRELMHGVMDKVMDDDFVHSYLHGFKMECLDGVWRRFYPRIFTYSADYPEKAMLALIRSNGKCPCPRCLVEKSEIHKLGMVADRKKRATLRAYVGDTIRTARRWIYEDGLNVVSSAVERLLSPSSWVPTLNTFAEKLGLFGIEPHEMLVTDLMHEVELGAWKAVFTHLVRILTSAAPAARLVSELDRRFRLIPTFGCSTIRKFSTNASEMKKLAARNYEDLLQCAIPAFDGLLPEPHNKVVMTLLFRLAEWHGLAKLRMHTETTLSHLDSATTTLGQELRRFSRVTCSSFRTVELPREVAARGRRQARQKAKQSGTQPASSTPEAGPATMPPPKPTEPSPAAASKKKKHFNMRTYKVHALGDYVGTIRRFGTTDSYSSQTGELEHRRVKKLYGRTNKNMPIRQMAKHERRETRLLRARKANLLDHAHHVKFSEEDLLPPTHPEMHHHISDEKRFGQDAFTFGRMYPDDPASKASPTFLMFFIHPDSLWMQDFVPRLKDHLLGRLLDRQYDGDMEKFTDDDRLTVRIVDNRLYSAKVLRVNYTTYDLQRGQDSMNPRTHCDVMVMSPETGPNTHPYWYARVIGVFHARIHHTGRESKNRALQHVEFLWVRWFEMDPRHRYGFKAARLPKVGFVPDTDAGAFGFLDPSLVIRGCHLIPAFNDLRTSMLLPATPTAGRPPGDTDDWKCFYVNLFVDRDMLMRYLGGGAGHVHQNRATPNEDRMDVDADENSERLAADMAVDDVQDDDDADGDDGDDGAGAYSDAEDGSEAEDAADFDPEDWGPEEDDRDDLGYDDL